MRVTQINLILTTPELVVLAHALNCYRDNAAAETAAAAGEIISQIVDCLSPPYTMKPGEIGFRAES